MVYDALRELFPRKSTRWLSTRTPTKNINHAKQPATLLATLRPDPMKTSVLSFSLAAVLAAGSLPAFAQNAAVVNGKPISSAKVDKLIASTGQPETPNCATVRATC
jgi:hypothetical protein